MVPDDKDSFFMSCIRAPILTGRSDEYATATYA
jgi:hypothetical protein